jgi:hypothetical protein
MTGNRASVILAWKGTRDRKRRCPQEGETMSITLPKHHQVLGYSTQSGQPVTKHLGVEITPSSQNGSAWAGESHAR